MPEAAAQTPILEALALILCIGAAWSTGRALADHWQPAWHVIPSAVLLTLAIRFLDYALFQGSLLSLSGGFGALVAISALALTAYRLKLAEKMVVQYPWLYRRAGPFGWREIRR